MFGSLRAQRTALVPLFKLLDRSVEVKQKVDDILDMSKAVVAPVGHPDVGPNPGWGEENVPAMFRPLLFSPEVTLVQEVLVLTTSLQKSLARYKMEACERAALNREHTNMYQSLADLTNNTSDTIRIFMRLYAVSLFNQRSLVKQKMAPSSGWTSVRF